MPAAIWPPGGVSIASYRHAAGPIVLLPSPEHRIVVHASPATWTVCHDTGSRHLRRDGDIDLVPAGETGGYLAEAACAALEIRLAPGMLRLVAAEMGQDRSGLGMRHMVRDDRLVHLARALDADRRGGGAGGTLYADSVGIALATRLVGLSTPLDDRRGGLSPRQLQRLFEYVETHIDETLTIDVLAREAGASNSHLRHWFRRETGMTVHRYVLRRRIERARLLLRQGTMTIGDVAVAAGFAHQSHMARWMRRELGAAPRALKG